MKQKLFDFDQHRCDFANMVTISILHLSLSSYTHQCRPCRSWNWTILAYVRSCACMHRQMNPLNSEPENKLSLEMSYCHFWDWWLLCKKTNLPTPFLLLAYSATACTSSAMPNLCTFILDPYNSIFIWLLLCKRPQNSRPCAGNRQHFSKLFIWDT